MELVQREDAHDPGEGRTPVQPYQPVGDVGLGDEEAGVAHGDGGHQRDYEERVGRAGHAADHDSGDELRELGTYCVSCLAHGLYTEDEGDERFDHGHACAVAVALPLSESRA